MLGRPLPWQDSFRLLLPVARALQFSHQQGIIHRDVKPSNILITLSGEPMLSDFGIAKLLESEGSTALTGTGVGIGTPEYMAPEQWVGKTSPQSDLYSLGVVLYEMVTGRKPYTADTPAAILLKQANEPLPRPRQSVPDLPERVEKVILKTLAKKPEGRYQSLEEFSSALETSLRGQVKARQPIQPSEKAEVEKQPEPEQAVVILPKQIEDQPTLNARLPEYVEPADAVSQIKDANKTEIAVPELPPFKMEQPNPVVEEIAKRENLAWFRASLETIKFRPVWILALVGLVVVVIVFVVWRMHPPLTQPVLTTVSARYTYFTSNQSGKAEVYYLDPQGKIAQFTHTPGHFESWSPAPADGGYVYFTPARPRHYRVYSAPNQAMWCCVGSGMENHGKYGQMIYTHNGNDSLFVNLFIPSKLNWKDKGIILTQETNFPYEQSTKLTISQSGGSFKLLIRHPSWVKTNEFSITINGEPYQQSSQPGSYLCINRAWNSGDKIEVTLPMHASYEQMPNVSKYIALSYGPILLGAKTGNQGLDGLVADDGRWSHIANGPLMELGSAPIIEGRRDSILQCLKPVDGKPPF